MGEDGTPQYDNRGTDSGGVVPTEPGDIARPGGLPFEYYGVIVLVLVNSLRVFGLIAPGQLFLPLTILANGDAGHGGIWPSTNKTVVRPSALTRRSLVCRNGCASGGGCEVRGRPLASVDCPQLGRLFVLDNRYESSDPGAGWRLSSVKRWGVGGEGDPCVPRITLVIEQVIEKDNGEVTDSRCPF